MGYSLNLDYLNPTHLSKIGQDYLFPKISVAVKEIQTISTSAIGKMSILQASDSSFIRIAGFSGATAVVLAAYGRHVFFEKPDIRSELKEVFRVANYYHFLHSLALLAVPMTNRPLLVGTLSLTGMSMFCGSIYAYALSGKKKITKITPYGGTVLVFAWLAMIF